MLFNSKDFILYFLPVVFVLYHLSPPRFRLLVICLASFFFYFTSGAVPAIFMLASIGWAYVCALVFQRREHHAGHVAIAAAFPLAVLFMFRYLGFTLETTGLTNYSHYFDFFLFVAVPAGISFYTFQIVSYSVDVYDGTIPAERNLTKLAAYISFFPQLIAGPILRYDQISAQFDRISTQRWVPIDIIMATRLIAFGLFFKVFVADMFGVYQDAHQRIADPTALDNLYLIACYSLRIYFDFWAYSTIAIGLGKLFGIDLPRNFREPYLSKNPKEFWRRWHITLSYWIRDYLYLRIGGNEHYIRNIIIVFAACGLWHGAGWNFVIWGLYHAALIVAYTLFQRVWDTWPGALQVFLTFVLVSMGWPLFFLDVSAYLGVVTSFTDPSAWSSTSFNARAWILLSLVMAFIFIFREDKWLFQPSGFYKITMNPFLHSVIIFACLIFTSWERTFIYFRF